ncbi:MAG: hypothetical protein K0R73_457 [Candidatus Midichloriaceae bacterium]|nr:hypothetical protein [Candidatus Midichloriaceae bacterium]
MYTSLRLIQINTPFLYHFGYTYFELNSQLNDEGCIRTSLFSGVAESIGKFFAILPYYKQSVFLNMDYMDIGNKGAGKFKSCLTDYPAGTKISLKSNDIGDFGFISIINSLKNKCNGISINLENNDISNIGFIHLAHAISHYGFPPCCIINLRRNNITVDATSDFVNKINLFANVIDFKVHFGECNQCRYAATLKNALKNHSDRAIIYLGITLLQTGSPFYLLPDDLKGIIFNLAIPIKTLSETYLKERVSYLGEELIAKSQFFKWLLPSLNEDCGLQDSQYTHSL